MECRGNKDKDDEEEKAERETEREIRKISSSTVLT
jgi:hypothetical protein